MAIPSVNQTIQSNGLGQSPAPVTDVAAVVGTCSGGVVGQVRKYAARRVSQLIAEQGYGPGVQLAALYLAAGKDVIFTKATSTTVGTQGVTGNGTGNGTTAVAAGTSVLTLSGNSRDDYEFKLEYLTGGTIGVAGITLRISYDGGLTYTGAVSLGTANSYVIPNTGVTIGFGAGTALAAGTHVWRGVAPKWASADLTAAAAALLSSYALKPFGFIHVAGPMSATEAATLKAALTTLESGYCYTSALVEARGADVAEAEATWMASIIADYAAFSSERMISGHGKGGRIASPVDGMSYMRPNSWAMGVRAASIPVEEEMGRVRGGPLNIAIYDTNGDLIAHDERVTPGLDAARFATVMSIVGLTGPYVANGNMLSASGSDFTLWPLRRVMDLVSTITYQQLVQELSGNVRVYRSGARAGFILEEDARAIEGNVNAVLFERVIKPGHAIDAQLILSRTDNLLSTKTLTSESIVVPVPIVKTINNTLRFVNPALAVAVEG